MTEDDLINLAIANAEVIDRNRDDEGKLPATSLLKSRASLALQLAIPAALGHNVVRRALQTYSHDLTITSATEYALPTEISQISQVTVGESRRPLPLFRNPSDFNRWYHNHYGTGDDATRANTADAPLVCTVFSRDSQQRWLLEFQPGVGGIDTATVWYMREVTGPPYKLSVIPHDQHYIVFGMMLVNLLGVAYQGMVDGAIAQLGDRVTPSLGTVSPMPQKPRIQRRINRFNSLTKPLV